PDAKLMFFRRNLPIQEARRGIPMRQPVATNCPATDKLFSGAPALGIPTGAYEMPHPSRHLLRKLLRGRASFRVHSAFNPHGEEARSAVSNHEAPVAAVRPHPSRRRAPRAAPQDEG